MSINSPFAFITEHKIHHLHSVLNIHEVIGPKDRVILVQETETIIKNSPKQVIILIFIPLIFFSLFIYPANISDFFSLSLLSFLILEINLKLICFPQKLEMGWQKLGSHVTNCHDNVSKCTLIFYVTEKPASHVTNCCDWHIFRILIVLSGRTKFQFPVSASLL